MMTFTTAHDLSKELGLSLHGPADTPIQGINALDETKKNHLFYLEKKDFPTSILAMGSSFLVSESIFHAFSFKAHQSVLVSSHPRASFIAVLKKFDPYQNLSSSLKDAKHLACLEGGSIGEQCIIAEGAKIGKGTKLMGQNYVGHNALIGENVTLYPGVKILASCVLKDHVVIHAGAVIGADGFGYETMEKKITKVPQIGNVVIEREVEIGANTTIDRATLGSTKIGEGTKIDNQVQIAHNVKIGKNCIIMGQVGIAGGCVLEDDVILAGQVGIAEQAYLETGVRVAAKSGIHAGKRIFAQRTIAGRPAMALKDHHRITVALKQLPALLPGLKKLLKD